MNFMWDEIKTAVEETEQELKDRFEADYRDALPTLIPLTARVIGQTVSIHNDRTLNDMLFDWLVPDNQLGQPELLLRPKRANSE